MEFMKQDEVERLRRQYPPGTKIECIHMNDDCHPVPDEDQFTKVKKKEMER